MAGIKSRAANIVNSFKKKKILPVQATQPGCLLEGKVALIVGGTGGIGFAIAEKLIENGCKVVLSGTNQTKLIERVNAIGDNASGVFLDLRDVALFEQKIKEVSQIFGTIDILINSGGVHTEQPWGFLDFTEEEYDKILDINLKGTYFISQAFAKWMIAHERHGHILNICSSAGSEPAWSPYRISKWGIRGLTEGMASKLQPYGIVVNAIAPGATATPLLGYESGDSIGSDDNRSYRYILPSEVAEYALLLVSSLGDMVVGDTLFISGGRGVCDIR